ncbi:hypothetical protein [Henriciella mobilis]|uniref:hypothetical protein n=1 Tax=Henriciella mobilis TaxID=2305467 RepID=UPI0013148667|nr:hypothetical protein [Henriciella mobilis]
MNDGHTPNKPRDIAKMHVDVPARDRKAFFNRRNELDLKNDRSSHRRFSYLYEDLLQ